MSQADKGESRHGAGRTRTWHATLLRSWWIVFGLTVLGALMGAASAALMPDEFTATSGVYAGQTTNANGAQILGIMSQSRSASEILASNEVVREAAARTGMGMTAEVLSEEITAETGGLIAISVTDADARRAAAAANALAEVFVERISEDSADRIAVLEDQLAITNAALKASTARSQAAKRGLRALLADDATDNSAAVASYVATMQAASSEQQALQAANQKVELLLVAATQVERPSIVYQAVAPSQPSRPRESVNGAVGALLGFVLGMIVALAMHSWRPHRNDSN